MVSKKTSTPNKPSVTQTNAEGTPLIDTKVIAAQILKQLLNDVNAAGGILSEKNAATIGNMIGEGVIKKIK
jgi:hypothetical protein